MRENTPKSAFFCDFIWSFEKKAVPLQSLCVNVHAHVCAQGVINRVQTKIGGNKLSQSQANRPATIRADHVKKKCPTESTTRFAASVKYVSSETM